MNSIQEESSTQNIRDIFQQSIQDSRNEINDIIPKEILTDDFDSIVDNTNEINPAGINAVFYKMHFNFMMHHSVHHAGRRYSSRLYLYYITGGFAPSL